MQAVLAHSLRIRVDCFRQSLAHKATHLSSNNSNVGAIRSATAVQTDMLHDVRYSISVVIDRGAVASHPPSRPTHHNAETRRWFAEGRHVTAWKCLSRYAKSREFGADEGGGDLPGDLAVPDRSPPPSSPVHKAARPAISLSLAHHPYTCIEQALLEWPVGSPPLGGNATASSLPALAVRPLSVPAKS